MFVVGVSMHVHYDNDCPVSCAPCRPVRCITSLPVPLATNIWLLKERLSTTLRGVAGTLTMDL